MHDDWDDVGYESLTDIEAFYHASPRQFAVGDVLTPQPEKNFRCSEDWVYLTDAPAPHTTVEAMARTENWLVYRVERLGALLLGGFDDVVCESARVVACLGPVSDFPGASAVLLKPARRPLNSDGRAIVGASFPGKTAGGAA